MSNLIFTKKLNGFKPGEETAGVSNKPLRRGIKVKIQLPPATAKEIGKSYVRTREGYYSNFDNSK